MRVWRRAGFTRGRDITCSQLTIAAGVSQTTSRTSGRRVLVVGRAPGPAALQLARGLAPGDLLICIDGDRAAAARAAEAFAREGLKDRANVMVGDPALFIRKVAGPFDLILIQVEEATAARIEPHLERLLAPGGRVTREGGGAALG